MINEMYTPTNEYPDRLVVNKPGRTFGGVAIGVLLFGVAGYALPPGSVENATTYKYPVHFRSVASATVDNVVRPGLNDEVLKDLIEAAQELVDQGCRAIIGGCGYFGNYIPEVREAVSVPCFMSSLMQLPMILNSMASDRKVAIICADGLALPGSAALRNCGIAEESRLVIAGGNVSEMPEMDLILTNSGGYNPKKLEREIVSVAQQLVQDDPTIGAILLECTLFPAVSHSVQDAVGLPVFDYMSMIDWVQGAIVQRRYHGYI
ncbi:aspartate/glutamate racemase family protein [Rhodococcus sp. 1R11]|uniref:aspartate/glutamate racemase family protein n=1 Tax=Rhodococcus sp. 1R11 TaxID=2559614 RepID=UPI0010716469|nr:aspartate/glutamate racemase family protein [Rhodococcus sp. 1R11]TFI42519.1 aspartate/glutamate racemase family protein [Rhodococcus sp. 1R11]